MTSCCRLDKGTLLSARWLRPRVTVLFCHSPYFYSFLSFHGLTGKSLDCRIKSGNDKKKNKAGNNSIIFSSVILGRNASRGSMDVRVKPEHDIEKKPEGDCKENKPEHDIKKK